MPLKFGFILLILVVFLGIVDMGRSLFLASQPEISQPVNRMDQMMT